MKVDRDRVFDAWAPSHSPWAAWVKPVLFACLPRSLSIDSASLPMDPFEPRAAVSLPLSDGATALVVDLPGARSLQLGEALIAKGFRPVPLFNAVPGADPVRTAGATVTPSSVVDIRPVVAALRTASLRSLEALERLSHQAPPAFLLDADRRSGYAGPGDFDNRSLSLPTDFPSASFLQGRGISRVLLVTFAESDPHGGVQPQADLAHTLLRWQVAGLVLEGCVVDTSFQASNPRAIVVSRPSRFGAMWHNALSLLGLRRHPLGGFGGTLPTPSAG